jgi:phosphatidylserine decarboxylase
VFRFARGSIPWLAAPLLVWLALVVLSVVPGPGWLGWLAFVPFSAFVFLVIFFRDPDRPIAGGVASPADGRVVRVDQVEDADIGAADRISIFMGPSDVHVNRSPLDGVVLSVRRHAGGHVPAFDKDSERNERVETLIETTLGPVKVIQIAGAVARRIVPYLVPGNEVGRGERLGLIRLGSRCDLLVARGRVAWMAEKGDRVFAGVSSLGAPKESKR